MQCGMQGFSVSLYGFKSGFFIVILLDDAFRGKQVKSFLLFLSCQSAFKKITLSLCGESASSVNHVQL